MAERRIALSDPAELARWYIERVEITIVLGGAAEPGATGKQVQIDPVRGTLVWTFEY